MYMRLVLIRDIVHQCAEYRLGVTGPPPPYSEACDRRDVVWIRSEPFGFVQFRLVSFGFVWFGKKSQAEVRMERMG